MKAGGTAPVGSATCVTSGGMMKNTRKVIHAVGPYYDSYDAQTNHELMQAVVLNILETAKKHGL